MSNNIIIISFPLGWIVVVGFFLLLPVLVVAAATMLLSGLGLYILKHAVTLTYPIQTLEISRVLIGAMPFAELFERHNCYLHAAAQWKLHLGTLFGMLGRCQ